MDDRRAFADEVSPRAKHACAGRRTRHRDGSGFWAYGKRPVDAWSIFLVIENGVNVAFPASTPALWLPPEIVPVALPWFVSVNAWYELLSVQLHR